MLLQIFTQLVCFRQILFFQIRCRICLFRIQNAGFFPLHEIDHCIEHNIGTLVIGKNDGWKQKSSLSKTANQTFVQIPYESFIGKLEYKCSDVGVNLIETEEGYTSGTSFLDNEQPIKENYDKTRRLYRGLFKANDGRLINADVNGAFQIMRKVFSNVKANEIAGAYSHPVIINL